MIERKGGSRKPADGNGEGLEPKFDLLTDNGNWKLIFTTGDMKTQKKIGGKISYVPIKAVQVSAWCVIPTVGPDILIPTSTVCSADV